LWIFVILIQLKFCKNFTQSIFKILYSTLVNHFVNITIKWYKLIRIHIKLLIKIIFCVLFWKYVLEKEIVLYFIRIDCFNFSRIVDSKNKIIMPKKCILWLVIFYYSSYLCHLFSNWTHFYAILITYVTCNE
jgi:hypothetical protein